MRSSELECALLALDEMKAQLDEARRQLKVMTEEHRLACEDRDLMQRERDEARREVLLWGKGAVFVGGTGARNQAARLGLF